MDIDNRMNAKLSLLSAAILLSVSPVYAEDSQQDKQEKAIETIEVSGDFHQQTLNRTPSSIAVITADMIRTRNAQHLEDVLNAAGNLNFSSGASRARFFQVRGIGERSEFVDAVNPSVGVSIDGIDYSGIGTVATLFDIDQVEVFRGPHGTRFGANAMAGMINLKGRDADGEQGGKVQLSYGNYNSQQVALAHGDAIADNFFYRASVQHLASDGYMENRFLNRDDTNDIKELGGRLALRWLPDEDLQLNLVSHYFDLDNGYDSFSLDNNRTTFSDQPGFDKQRTRALGFTADYSGFASADLTLVTSYNNSDLAYGYDEDWAYDGFHDWGYNSFDHYFRDHNNFSVDLRASSKPGTKNKWVTGMYRQRKDSDLERLSVYGFAPLFKSQFTTRNFAWYGQKDWQMDDQVVLTTGLRMEENEQEYIDTVGTVQSPQEFMWGGKINLSYQVTDETMIYGSISRGYKNGGINGEAIGKAIVDGQDTAAEFLTERTTFDPEVLINYEFGVKGSNPEGTVLLRFAAFYSDRKDVQLKGYVQELGSDGSAPIFTGYIENGANGKNYGLESDLTYHANEQLSLFVNVGLLRTEIEGFIAEDGTDMSGRDQAHAPEYQFNIGATYQINENWYISGGIEGKDEFFYSMSHNAQSDAYELVNLSVGYQSENWEVTLWGRNLTDEDYGVRGFFFGNDPRDGYEAKTYTQFGEPARYGATFNYNF